MSTATLPATQTAIQLVGPDLLKLNPAKAVVRPGPTQILGKVECVGLCFSDMKLLHQFDKHARKTPVLQHLAASVLKEIPSYVPEGSPTVPGHEVVIRVVEAGAKVTSVQAGKRYLVQADWRDLKTAGSNGAFGYNFEGGLQEFVLLDERTTLAKDGTSYLIPVTDERSASQLALVEPWACVEEAFIHHERGTLTAGGTLLLVTSPGATADLSGLDTSVSGKRLCLGDCTPAAGFTCIARDQLAAGSVDDILFVGADAALAEDVMGLMATNGLMVIAQAGQTFGRPLQTPVGRVHYGNVRLIGTSGAKLSEALARIPTDGEVKPGQAVSVVGAAGPMGTMATIRLVSTGLKGLTVEAADMAVDRLAVLKSKAEPVAKARGVALRCYNPKEEKGSGSYDYHMIMVPVPALVAAAVGQSKPNAVINIFAGIAADVKGAIDLDTYCAKGLYFIGTSGSTMEDMMVVLGKVLDDRLDTNISVGAISGMGGAIAGLDAVKNNTIAGKILVYPQLGNFPLTVMEDLVAKYPTVKAKLVNGCWTKAAEDELLRVAVTA